DTPISRGMRRDLKASGFVRGRGGRKSREIKGAVIGSRGINGVAGRERIGAASHETQGSAADRRDCRASRSARTRGSAVKVPLGYDISAGGARSKKRQDENEGFHSRYFQRQLLIGSGIPSGF